MSPKILIIDSNVGSLITLKVILKETIPDCVVITASFREQGIEKARKELPDTILLNYNILEKDGYEICKILKRDAEIDVPLILLNSNGVDIEECFKDLSTFVDAIIKKPFTGIELEAKINHLMQSKDINANIKTVGDEESEKNEGNHKNESDIKNNIKKLLSAIKADLQWIKKRLPEKFTQEHNKINSMFEFIELLTRDKKKSSSKIDSSSLNETNFISSIKLCAENFQNRTGLNCKIHFIPKDIVVSTDLSNLLHDVLIEVLNNIEKHANASSVKITVNLRLDNLVMKVIDNGIGIMEEKINSPNSLGLKEIKERVHLNNGNVIVRGFVGKGTKAIINIPLKDKPE